MLLLAFLQRVCFLALTSTPFGALSVCKLRRVVHTDADVLTLEVHWSACHPDADGTLLRRGGT